MRDDIIPSCSTAYYISKYIMNVDNPSDAVSLDAVSNKAELLELLLGFTERGYAEMCQFCSGRDGINMRTIPPGEQF